MKKLFLFFMLLSVLGCGVRGDRIVVDTPEGWNILEDDFEEVEGQGKVLWVMEGGGCSLTVVEEKLMRRSGISNNEQYAAAAMNALGVEAATERKELGGREFVRMRVVRAGDFVQDIYARVEGDKALIVTASYAPADSAIVAPALRGIKFE